MAEAFERFADGFMDPCHQRDGLVAVAEVGLDDGEFVAAESRHHARTAHAAPQPLRHRLQQRVTDRVAE